MGRSIRLRPWFRWFLPRLLLALGLYAGGYTALNAVLSARVAAQLDGIRQRGEPASAAELKQPEIPVERDAGPYFRGACAVMEGLSESMHAELGDFWIQVDLIEGGDPREDYRGWVNADREPVDVADVDAWLQRNPALEALLAEVLARPECKGSVSFDEEGPFVLLPHLMPAKQLSYVVLASSSAAAARGDVRRAVDQHELGYALSACVMGDRHCLISALVGGAVEGMAYDHLQLLLSGGALGEAELSQLDATLSRLPDMGQVYREALIGERAGFGVFVFEAAFEGRNVSYLGDLPAATGALRLNLLVDFSVYLEQLGEAVQFPWGEQVDPSYHEPIPPSYALLSSMFIPATMMIRERMKQVELKRVVSRCALALERERLTHGSLPEALDPEFADRELLYERTPDGFTLTVAHPEDALPQDIVSFRVKR